MNPSSEKGHTFSTQRGGDYCQWNVLRLWDLAESLPVRTKPIVELKELENTWLQDLRHPSTADFPDAEWERIMEADLNYPIILSSTGEIMDGYHRVAKAFSLGIPTIQYRQFETDPEPDFTCPYEKVE